MIYVKEDYNIKVLCKCYYLKLLLLFIFILCFEILVFIFLGLVNLILFNFGRINELGLQNFGSRDKGVRKEFGFCFYINEKYVN